MAGADAAGKHLFILSGQSNMAGLNPKKSFTPVLEEEFGKDNVIVVKDAKGGEPIRRWYKEWEGPADARQPDGPIGDLYDRLMEKVGEATAGADLETVTFVWMQGERDANDGNGELYARSLRGLIDQLSEDLERDDLNFVIGRVSDWQNPKRLTDWEQVRGAQVEVAEASPRGAWVDTDDLNDGLNRKGEEVSNNLHYTPEGYQTLGARFAEKAVELIQSSDAGGTN